MLACSAATYSHVCTACAVVSARHGSWRSRCCNGDSMLHGSMVLQAKLAQAGMQEVTLPCRCSEGPHNSEHVCGDGQACVNASMLWVRTWRVRRAAAVVVAALPRHVLGWLIRPVSTTSNGSSCVAATAYIYCCGRKCLSSVST